MPSSSSSKMQLVRLRLHVFTLLTETEKKMKPSNIPLKNNTFLVPLNVKSNEKEAHQQNHPNDQNPRNHRFFHYLASFEYGLENSVQGKSLVHV